MSTATKLEYLNDTKGLLKNGINSIGGNITSQTTFRQYATELDSIYASLPKVSGTGSSIQLTPTKQGRITSQINGDTLQDGTPTPTTPVEIQSVTGLQKVGVCGKNFAKLKNGTYTRGNNTLVITNNSLLTINSNETGGNTYISLGNGYTQQWSPTQAQYVNINDMKLTPNGGDYIATIYSNKTSTAQIQFTIITSKNRSVTVSNLQNNTQGTLNISLESDEHIKDIGMWMSGNNVFDDYQVRVQIEKGSSSTTYEAFSGETYDINLGKNLFDNTYNNLGFWSGNVGQTTTFGYNANYLGAYCKVQPGIYSISRAKITNRFVIALCKDIPSTDTSSTGIVVARNDSAYKIENINVSSEYNYIAIYLSNSADTSDNLNLQIEQGTEATSYSEYFTPIHLYENDQIIGTPDNWSIKHTKKEVVFDGNENWNITQNNSVLYVTNIEDYAVSNNIPYSNYFQGIDNVAGAGVMSSKNENTMAFINNHTNYRLYIKKTTFASVSDFKTWLSTHNTKVVYDLATPTTTPITDTTLINDLNTFYYAMSKNGETNISVDGSLPIILDVSCPITSIATPTETINITSNGTTNVLNYANANVNVQPNLETKSITITENNTTTTITPTTGKDGMSSVEVTTNISGGGGNDWADTGWNNMPPYIQDIHDTTKTLYDNWNPSNPQTNYFTNNFDMVVCPKIDTSNVNTFLQFFKGCSKLQDVPADLDVGRGTFREMFTSCTSLKTIDISNYDTSDWVVGSVGSLREMFMNCSKLEHIDFGDFITDKFYPKTNNTLNMFTNCTKLDNSTLNSILKLCILITPNIPATSKKLSILGINNTFDNYANIPNLSNYQDFINAGWTLN